MYAAGYDKFWLLLRLPMIGTAAGGTALCELCIHVFAAAAVADVDGTFEWHKYNAINININVHIYRIQMISQRLIIQFQ